ncbi:GNAT family N-acetyltransferase [Haloarchaeobius sp. HRN-SO-5]|uniref:GNAT family N-acetyltransferase n=1 Tax=Haloarchaeobius sp. HRN-SO-5 TaxID=3446118 RepID=UPI003EBB3191
MADPFPGTFETDRLRFERIGPGTPAVHDVYDHFAHEDGIEQATRYMFWEPHAHPEETRDFVDRSGRTAERGEDAKYAIYVREGEDGAGEFAGTTGLHTRWDRRTVEYGIWLRKPFWGRGYSGERAVALAELAFDRLDLDLVAVTVLDENDQSRRAIEKYVDRLGGQYDGYFRHLQHDGDGPVGVHRYTVDRAQYEGSDGDR